MAGEIESIAVLLGKAAVTYLKSDEAIIKAFQGDHAEQDKIKGEIGTINTNLTQFKQDFAKAKNIQDTVKNRADEEKKKSDKKDAQDAFDYGVNHEVMP